MSANQSSEIQAVVSMQDEEQSTISEDTSMIKYITNEDDLEIGLVDAGKKLVVLSFLLLGNDENERMLQFLSEKANMYRNSIVVIMVDVAKCGELAQTCEAVQIPWFVFLRDNKKIEAYHSINCHRIGNTIRSCIGEEPYHTIRTYIKDSFDLNKRLVDAKNRLVLLAFLIPGDVGGERLNIDLDEIEQKNDEICILKVDVDTCKDVTAKYHIQGVPTIVFIKNRTFIQEMSALEMDKLSQEVTKLSKKGKSYPEKEKKYLEREKKYIEKDKFISSAQPSSVVSSAQPSSVVPSAAPSSVVPSAAPSSILHQLSTHSGEEIKPPVKKIVFQNNE